MSRRENAWARIGALLALLQHVEREINVFLAWRFPDQPVTLEQIASFKKSEKAKTLGALIRTLRKQMPKIDRDKTWQTFLSTFVEDRNRFVHRLFTEEGYNINNPKDVSRIRKFVDSLTHRSTLFDIIFHGFNESLDEPQRVPLWRGGFQWPPALKHRKGEFERGIKEAFRRRVPRV